MIDYRVSRLVLCQTASLSLGLSLLFKQPTLEGWKQSPARADVNCPSVDQPLCRVGMQNPIPQQNTDPAGTMRPPIPELQPSRVDDNNINALYILKEL